MIEYKHIYVTLESNIQEDISVWYYDDTANKINVRELYEKGWSPVSISVEIKSLLGFMILKREV